MGKQGVGSRLGRLQKVRERIRLAWWALSGRKALSVSGALSSLDGTSVDQNDIDTLVNKGYKQAETVYGCVRAISTSASDVPVYVTVDGEIDDDHALKDLLEHPWPWLSQFELIERTLTWLSVAGKSAWWKQRSGAGRVVGLYPLRMDLLRPVAGKTLDAPVVAYEYTGAGRLTRFPPEDICYFSYFDPLNESGGFPPLAVGMDNVDADNLATKFIQYFFRRGAMLGGLLSTEQKLDNDEVDFLREKWRQQYAGMQHWGEMAVLSHGATYQQLGISMTDMAFTELREMSESRICMIFGVPPILIHALVGLKHATYSNFEQAQKIFWVNTLAPLYGRLEDKISMNLGPEFGDGVKVVLALDEAAAMQESRDKAWNRANLGVSGSWVMVNEGRAEVGLPPVVDGDVFLRPMMLLAEDGQVEGGKSWMVMPGQLLMDQFAKAPGSGRQGKAAVSDEAKERHAKQRDLIAHAWESRFRDEARRLFDEEVKKIKALVQDAAAEKRREGGGQRKAVAWMGVLFSVKQLMDARKANWRDGFLPLFKALVGAQGETIAADFGIDFSLSNPLVLDWLAGYSFKFADKLVDVSTTDLMKLFQQAQDEGWGIPQMQDSLQGLYDGWDRLRAEMIARTETIRSSNAGARMAYRAAGVKEIEWHTAEDERVCPFCGEMHGKVVGIEELFFQQGDEMVVTIPDDDEKMWRRVLEFKRGAGGEERETWEWAGTVFELKERTVTLKFGYEDVAHPPLHPDCRCTLLPVVKVEKAIMPAARPVMLAGVH